MNIPEYIGQVIRYHRKSAGLSQKALADLSGVGKTVVFDIEKGKETTQLKSIMHIFNALNINLMLESPLMEAYNKITNEKG